MDVDFNEGYYYFRGGLCFVVVTGIEQEKLQLHLRNATSCIFVIDPLIDIKAQMIFLEQIQVFEVVKADLLVAIMRRESHVDFELY